MNSLLARMFPRWFDYADPDSFVSALRTKRFRPMRELLLAEQRRLGRPLAILDVGGAWPLWKHCMQLPEEDFRVRIINLEKEEIPDDMPNVESAVGNALAIDEELDGIDAIFSNSVIEHVGSFANQRRMAEQIRASGLPYIVQTPNYWFPFEPHAHLPFFQFLPHQLRAWLIKWFRIPYFPSKPTYRECLEVSYSTMMVGMRRFRAMFPDAEISRERLFGLTKSFTAWGGFRGG